MLAALSLTRNNGSKDGMFSALSKLGFYSHFLLLSQLVEMASSFPVCGHTLPSGSGLTLAPIQALLAAVYAHTSGSASQAHPAQSQEN